MQGPTIIRRSAVEAFTVHEFVRKTKQLQGTLVLVTARRRLLQWMAN